MPLFEDKKCKLKTSHISHVSKMYFQLRIFNNTMYVYFWHFLVVFINIQDTLTGTVLHTNSFMFCHIL